MDDLRSLRNPNMTIDYFLPAIGNQALLDECLFHLCRNLDNFGSTSLHIIDNGSAGPLVIDPVVRQYCTLHRQEENLGMIESLVFAMRNSTADVLVYSHTDFFIYEAGFDSTIAAYFEADDRLGLIGAVGAAVAAANGGREDVLCSFIDGHRHGVKTPPGIHPAAILDGCFMVFRRRDLDRVGIDRSFKPHHFYDKDWSLGFTLAGVRVGVMSLYCQHRGGQTSCRPEYQQMADAKGGDHSFYLENEAKYIAKHAPDFPVRVNPDWTVERNAR